MIRLVVILRVIGGSLGWVLGYVSITDSLYNMELIVNYTNALMIENT
jgi:hypothetical protein